MALRKRWLQKRQVIYSDYVKWLEGDVAKNMAWGDVIDEAMAAVAVKSCGTARRNYVVKIVSEPEDYDYASHSLMLVVDYEQHESNKQLALRQKQADRAVATKIRMEQIVKDRERERYLKLKEKYGD